MNYWLIKSEPNTYSWEDLENKKEETWDGIRNYQARNYLKEMESGDPVLFYHSGKNREIVGVAEVTEAAFPDPDDKENKGWVAVKIKANTPLSKPVSLDHMKASDKLRNLPLLKQSRLSVMPVKQAEFDHILKIGS